MEKVNNIPTEVVDLPSKGLLYPKDSPLAGGTIEMKYMTAKEEDILTNQAYIQKGIVIDKLLQALIVSPIQYKDLLICDKNAVMVAREVGPTFVQLYTPCILEIGKQSMEGLDEMKPIDLRKRCDVAALGLTSTCSQK